MNFVQQLEECLRDLAAEARKNHPGVKEASERATWTLRQYQNTYASAVRQANAASTGGGVSAPPPTTKLFQSSELLHPFLLAANYPNASPKLLEISFKAMRLLLEADAVVPTDAIHLVRVWMIQAQVVAAFYQKHYHSNQRASRRTNNEASVPILVDEDATNRSDGDGPSSQSPGNTTGATSSQSGGTSSNWFFWSSTSTSTSNRTNQSKSISTASAVTSEPSLGSHVVSSSTGQTGHSSSTASSKDMEKLALDILSSLLQLIQGMHRNCPKSLAQDIVLWKHAFAVVCLCLSPFMNQSSRRSSASGGAGNKKKKSTSGTGSEFSVIQQAAHSTLSQLLSLLYEPIQESNEQSSDGGEETLDLEKEPNLVELRRTTWKDLLRLSQSAAIPTTESSLCGAFALCKTAPNTIASSKASQSPPICPPSPTLALQVLTKLWRNSLYRLDDALALETMQAACMLLQNVRITTSVEVTHAILQWTSLVLSKLGSSYPEKSFEIVNTMLQLVATATESCRDHPDFEDGFVFTQSLSSSRIEDGSGNAMTTSRSAMTQPQQQDHQPQQQKQHNQPNHMKPLVVGATLGKASLALDVLNRVLNDENVAKDLMKDRTTSGLLAETLSDFATLCASSEGHMIQLIDFVASRAGEEGQEQQQQPPPTTFVRRLEHDVDADWEALVDHATLGEALWLSLSGLLRILESITQLPYSERFSLDEIFVPSLAVFQHYLKRFSGCDVLVRLSLDGYQSLARLCFPSLDMQKALLTSLCKLSLPAWGKHDSSSCLEDHHIASLLCVIEIMHHHRAQIGGDWEVVMMTLEELSVLSIASPLLTEEAYHSALTISSMYGRLAAFSTCFDTKALLKLVEALCQVVQSSLDDDNFLIDSSKGTQGTDTSSGEKHSESFSRQIMNIGVRAIYGSQTASEVDAKASEIHQSDRTKNRYYDEYLRDFTSRISKSKNTIRIDSVGRIPFTLAVLADVAMVNTYRYNECGEKISGSLSSLAASSASVRPFLMDTIAILTMARISEEDEGSPTPFVGPGRIVFQNPMQSQLLAVERVLSKEQSEGVKSTKDIVPQTDALGPLCDSLRTAKSPDVAESSLETIYSVLETTGHNLSGDVWPAIIGALSTLSGTVTDEVDRSGSTWSQCSLDAFRCLKLIVNDFIDELGGESDALTSLLDCCAAFGSSRQDVNTSLTAIGLLWTIADQDATTDSVDRALSRLVLLASDSRAEVRNASVNTLFSCIAGRGSGFSPERWESCVQGTIFKVYDTVVGKARGDDTDKEEGTVQAEKGSRYKVSLHHSRDSESKQWITTQVVVLRGLIRVLRNYFQRLLDTVDTEPVQPVKSNQDDVPWFQDAWVRILDYAYEAAAQGGDRDTLDIRSVGVELIVLCCQVSSQGGIQAGSSARVSTNMEVVDGTLRTVRETKPPKPNKKKHQRSHSSVCEVARKTFFLEAFESLESYVEFLGNLSKTDNGMDDTQLQVVHKFSSGLSSLYDCSKQCELLTDNRSKCLASLSYEETTHTKEEKLDLEERFVTMIVEVAHIATVDASARYLNQAQRSCLLLLKTIGKDGSYNALCSLVELGDVYFFIKKEDGSDATKFEKSELVGLEAVASVAEALAEEAPPSECKTMVLSQVLQVFLREGKDGVLADRQNQRFKIDYKRLIPVVIGGIDGCAALDESLQCMANKESTEAKASRGLLEKTWTSLIQVFSLMIEPVPMGKGMQKVSRVLEVTDLTKAIVPKTPRNYAAQVCEILVQAANNCLEVAELHERCSIKHTDKDVAMKSKRHRDELIQLFTECFEGCCTLQPDHPDLLAMSKKTLERAVLVMFSPKEDGETFMIDATLSICKCVRDFDGGEALLPFIFPSLCKLISSQDNRVKVAVAETLGSEKTYGILNRTQERVEIAERKAELAEDRANTMFEESVELRKKNERLKRDLAVFEASAGL